MPNKQDLGTFFWRGGQRIEVDKEEQVFTASASDEAQVEQLRTMPGVEQVKPLQGQIFKVYVAKGKTDEVMAKTRAAARICHHAYRPQAAKNTRYYLTDQIVVQFKPEAADSRIAEITAEEKVRLLRDYPGAPNTFLLQVTSDAKRNPIKVANSLAARDEVVFAEPNLINRFQTFHIPTDTLFPRQWHLHSTAGADLAEDADVSAPQAWDVTRGSREVVVAVIDDGFDLTHPDFTGSGKVVHGKDYVDGDANPFPETTAGDYHGTPCAGVAIAEENGSGVVGIAPGCAFMPVRFPLTASDSMMWDIFDFVGQRSDVISCSWGPPPANAPLGQLLSDKLHTLATTGGRRKKGCVIVFAAGNYNAPLSDPANTSFQWYHPKYGVVETTGPILNGNATHPDVVAVASSTSLSLKAAYSNWGREISVCAPSNNRHPLDPYAYVPGLGIWTTDNEQYGEGFTAGDRFTGRFGGTSSATPLVAGVAALVISANPLLSASQVKEILEETADKIIDNNPDPALGLCKGTYNDNGHSEWFGFGRVNAAAAVRRARELVDDDPPIALDLRVRAADNLAEQGATRLFKVKIGARLRVRLDGPQGQDFDLYIKRGSPPTTTDYDAVGYSSGAHESVVLDPTEPGEYYLLVRSYRGAGDFDLAVELE